MSSLRRNSNPRLAVFGNTEAPVAATGENDADVSASLEPPPILVDEIAIDTWNNAVQSLHSNGKISGLQQTLLVGYCIALSKALRAEEILSREGPYYMAANNNGLVLRRRHPAVQDAEKGWHAVRQFARQLGIPAALKSAPGMISERRAIFK